MRKVIFLCYLAVFFVSIPARADVDIEKFMRKDHGFEQNVWKVLMKADAAIMQMKQGVIFSMWCANEGEKDDGLTEVCVNSAQHNIDAERFMIESLSVLDTSIKRLEYSNHSVTTKKILLQQLQARYAKLKSFSVFYLPHFMKKFEDEAPKEYDNFIKTLTELGVSYVE